MERNYDEIIPDMLVQVTNMEARLEKDSRRAEARFEKEGRRIDLTIKRMVKAESRLELFDRKLEQSIKSQKEFFDMQSQMNRFFLDQIKG
jgi:vacuolar-type H+-ATPase subunit E/Vma4